MNYAVVNFTAENSVGIIPTRWIADDRSLCLWPPYKSIARADLAVKKVEQPDGTWSSIAIEIYHEYGEF